MGAEPSALVQVQGVVVAKSRSIRGDVKDIFLPRPEAEDISLPSSPCARDEALGRAADLAWFHLGCILIE